MTAPTSEQVAASAKASAEEFAQSFAGLGLAEGALDFSKESLAVLDAGLVQARERVTEPEALQALAVGAGAYLAEVISRRAPVKLRWVPAAVIPGPADPSNPFLLCTPKNLVLAVLGKPHQLLAKGDPDTLGAFAQRVQDLLSREATAG